MIWMSSPARSRSRRIGVSGEAHGLRAQFADVGGAEHLERGEQRRGREDRRIAHGPAGGAGGGPELGQPSGSASAVRGPTSRTISTARSRNAARARSNRRSRRDRRSDTCTSTTRRSRRPSRAAAAAGCRWHAPCRSRRWRRRDARRARCARSRRPGRCGTARRATARARARCRNSSIFASMSSMRRVSSPARGASSTSVSSGSSLCQESWPRMAWRSEENAPASMSTLSRMPTGR